MNYFEDHIGDYAAATAHLTWDEDMAYTRLIRAYYHSEKPIPKDKAHRLARATTPAQRRAVDAVIEEFFSLEDGSFRQKRCDEEIARFQQKQAQDPAKKENDRDRQARARARRKALFEELRHAGIIAPWDASTEQLQAALSQLTSQQSHTTVTRDKPCDNTATQTPYPDTIPNKKNTSASAPPPAGVSDSVWADFLKIRKAKRAPMTDTALEGVRREAAKAGMTLADALAMCCTRGWQGFEARWLEDKKPAFTPPSPALTVPAKPGVDPALAKCIADSLTCKGPPPEIRSRMKQLSGARG